MTICLGESALAMILDVGLLEFGITCSWVLHSFSCFISLMFQCSLFWYFFGKLFCEWWTLITDPCIFLFFSLAFNALSFHPSFRKKILSTSKQCSLCFNFCNHRLNFLEDFFSVCYWTWKGFVPFPILVLRLQCSSILLRLLRMLSLKKKYRFSCLLHISVASRLFIMFLALLVFSYQMPPFLSSFPIQEETKWVSSYGPFSYLVPV